MKAFITAVIDEVELKRLKTKVDEIVYEPWRETSEIYFSSKRLAPKLDGVDIFITEPDEVKEDLVKQTDLKIIAACRQDPYKVNIEAATEKGIPVLYTPARNADSVADLAVLMMLSLARKLTQVDRFIHSDKFEIIEMEDYLKVCNDYIGMELRDKTVGIIGFGNIGQRVGDRVKSFGAKILVHDPFVSNNVVDKYGMKAGLEELMEKSDFITIHAAPVPATDGMVSKEMISKMKPTACLINTAKANMVDSMALYNALQEGKIGGAGLDVFDLEPLDEDNEFLEFDNVIALPHFGGNTVDTVKKQSKMIVDDILAVLNDEKPDNIANPEVLDMKVTSKEIKQLCQDVVNCCQEMVRKGWISGSSGNVSARIPGRDEIVITPSTLGYNEMTADDMVILNFDGKQIGGDRNPSVEKDLHLGVYKAREDVGAVIHSHGENSIAFSLVRDELPPIVEEFVPYVGGPVTVAEYAEAGTKELAANIIKALDEKNAAIAQLHGNVCCGSHLDGAMTVLRMVERVCGIYLKAAPLGEPRELDEDTVDYEMDMYDIFKMDKKV